MVAKEDVNVHEYESVGRNIINRKIGQPVLSFSFKTSQDPGTFNLDAIPKTARYEFDGGSLLHKLKWRRGDTYGKIAKAYADFTIKDYGAATSYGEVP